MHPKSEISRINRTFSSQEKNHYYVIKENTVPIGDLIALNLKSIMINGLSNFKFMNITPNEDYYRYHGYHYHGQYSNLAITSRINNLKGQADWKYDSDAIVAMEYAPLRFEIDHITIKAQLQDDRLQNVDVNISSLITSLRSTDSLVSLATNILEKKLAKIIASSISNSISVAYNGN